MIDRWGMCPNSNEGGGMGSSGGYGGCGWSPFWESGIPNFFYDNGQSYSSDEYYDMSWEATKSGYTQKYGSTDAGIRAMNWERRNEQSATDPGFLITYNTKNGDFGVTTPGQNTTVAIVFDIIAANKAQSGSGGSGLLALGPGDTDPNTASDAVGNYGTIISTTNAAAALGPVGVMMDLGVVTDSYGNSNMYFTIGWLVGYGASVGAGYSRTSKGFKLESFAGYSEGFLLSLPYLSGEVFGDYSQGCANEYRGTKYFGGGLNVGVGAIYGAYHSYTFIAPIPKEGDWWCKPGRLRR